MVSDRDIWRLALTGYGKDLLKDILGADCPVVETIAHASAGLHFFPDADCICDVGGVDVKIMILNNGAVTDFRLNSQCSSGNGAFLQGVAERFNIPHERHGGWRVPGARRCRNCPWAAACSCRATSSTSNARDGRRKKFSPGSAPILPLNVWIYAGRHEQPAAGRAEISSCRAARIAISRW